MFKNRLEEIKALHDEANEKAPSNAYADIDRVSDILQELFQEEHTDWLIEQAGKAEIYMNALKSVQRYTVGGKSSQLDHIYDYIRQTLTEN